MAAKNRIELHFRIQPDAKRGLPEGRALITCTLHGREPSKVECAYIGVIPAVGVERETVDFDDGQAVMEVDRASGGIIGLEVLDFGRDSYVELMDRLESLEGRNAPQANLLFAMITTIFNLCVSVRTSVETARLLKRMHEIGGVAGQDRIKKAMTAAKADRWAGRQLQGCS